MSIEMRSKVEDGCNVTEFNVKEDNEPSIYDLQFLVYRLDLQREYKLSDLETKIISFILSYANISQKFYFGNESLGRIFDKHPITISKSVGLLEEKGLISTETTMRANGGQIRFIHLSQNAKPILAKTLSSTKSKHLQSNNKVNNNKKNKQFNSKIVDNSSYRERIDKEIEATRKLLDEARK